MDIEQQVITDEQSITFLDMLYDHVLNGIPKVKKPIMELVGEYTGKYGSMDNAIRDFVKVQRLKVTTTGFLTGLGASVCNKH